jgi:hypothetical protein
LSFLSGAADMTEENASRLFAHIRDFSWNDDKRDRTLREREIDFNDARFIGRTDNRSSLRSKGRRALHGLWIA